METEVSYEMSGSEWDFELAKKSRNCWFEIIIRSQERAKKEDNRKHGIWCLIHNYGNTAFIVCKDTYYCLTSVLASRQKPEYVSNRVNECSETREGNSVLGDTRNSGKKTPVSVLLLKYKIFIVLLWSVVHKVNVYIATVLPPSYKYRT